MTQGKKLVDALSFDFLPTSTKNIGKKVSDKRVFDIRLWLFSCISQYETFFNRISHKHTLRFLLPLLLFTFTMMWLMDDPLCSLPMMIATFIALYFYSLDFVIFSLHTNNS